MRSGNHQLGPTGFERRRSGDDSPGQSSGGGSDTIREAPPVSGLPGQIPYTSAG